MVTKETESLTQMLLESRVSQLPEENDPAKIWVLALVKVLRKTGQKDYVIAEHDFFGWNEIRVKSEMAGVGILAEVESIHPYSYLTALDMPTVKTKEDIINFLASRTKEDAEYLSSLGNDVLKRCCTTSALRIRLLSGDRNRTMKTMFSELKNRNTKCLM